MGGTTTGTGSCKSRPPRPQKGPLPAEVVEEEVVVRGGTREPQLACRTSPTNPNPLPKENPMNPGESLNPEEAENSPALLS